MEKLRLTRITSRTQPYLPRRHVYKPKGTARVGWVVELGIIDSNRLLVFVSICIDSVGLIEFKLISIRPNNFINHWS